MKTIKQTLKMTSITKLLIILGLVLGFWILFLGTNTADAASKQAEDACKNIVGKVSREKRQTFRQNINSCYYGYDQVGTSQNSIGKCRNQFSNINKYGACLTGAVLAKRAASTPPPIERCDQDNAQRTRQCKREYRECNRIVGPFVARLIVNCKRKAIRDFGPRDGRGGNRSGRESARENSEPTGIGEAGRYTCGTYTNQERNVRTKFNFGCIGTKFARTGQGQENLSPILDLAFAFIRFLSIGVGIVIAISIIMSGIQYTMSEGNAEVTQKAKSRIRSAVLGLAIYIFTFSILQFLIPGGIFRPGIWVDENILQLISRLL